MLAREICTVQTLVARVSTRMRRLESIPLAASRTGEIVIATACEYVFAIRLSRPMPSAFSS